MTAKGNVEIVQATYAAFGRGDLPGLLEHLSDAIDWEFFGPGAIPYAGNRRGKEAVADFFAKLGGTAEHLMFEPDKFVAQGDTVIVLGREKIKVRETGREAEVNWAHAFTIAGGKVVKFREYSDTDKIRRAYKS